MQVSAEMLQAVKLKSSSKPRKESAAAAAAKKVRASEQAASKSFARAWNPYVYGCVREKRSCYVETTSRPRRLLY